MTAKPPATAKLLTIVTEAALESRLLADLERRGARGYTVTNARGKGQRGARQAGWDVESNIRIEIVCDENTARGLLAHLKDHYYDDYAMILWLGEVEVLRPEKFEATPDQP